MQLVAYLNFDGTCAAAFKFYEQCLGGKLITLQTHGDSPMAEQTPPEWHSRILHARLEIGDAILMGSDYPPGEYQQVQGFAVSLSVADPAEAERIFHALAENGTITMPIAETFWAVRFGMLVDQFGTPWMVNCDQAA